ncbi:metal ABC transporter ATP-binding protein [Neisseria leonii]|uniref:Metal ABC transporter ATP-binding protein n=1 Tax=Neisseria leonii TaxID=2995413 RepID=A0A9X4E3Z4_9NEIS|nr:metal ABC transporter ATP-binding protein [Neisseria sp. 51.81]MDD9327556.1 metal ABC transporter ATP-binding protein [Neisseria sp. 51.81]
MKIMLENLTAGYGGRTVVRGADVCFGAGQMWAVVGANGAGKSTLLKTVVGLSAPVCGRVVRQGLVRRDLAYLPQRSEIDRSLPLTVFELAAMGLWHEIGFSGRVRPAQRERVRRALVQVGMWDSARRLIGSLSEGQFRRVLFARLLVQEAAFLLLDEPFDAVDAETAGVLLNVLRDCNRAGRAVVAVLHDYGQVRAYFPHTLVLADGGMRAGRTEEVLGASVQAGEAV